MDRQLFTVEDAWAGGFYELALEIGPRSDDRLRAALAAVWRHPDLEGCYHERSREPSSQPRIFPDHIEDGSHLQGVARMPNGSRVVCGTCLIREVDEGPDWLDFYLPMGSLGLAYPVGGFPFGTDCSEPWRNEVDDWLAGIGLSVARTARFRLGVPSRIVVAVFAELNLHGFWGRECRFPEFLKTLENTAAMHLDRSPRAVAVVATALA